MISNRRTFLKQTTTLATAGLALAPRTTYGQWAPTSESTSYIDDSRIKELIQRGLDATRSSGATYADIRMTHLKDRRYGLSSGRIDSGDVESMTVGVRVLANGYWGFASGSVWTADEMARLAGSAVSLAKTNALGKVRTTVLAPATAVRDGQWTMPVKIDPFQVSRAEIKDYLMGLGEYSKRYTDWGLQVNSALFTVIDKWFGSTEGNTWYQRTFASRGIMGWLLTNRVTRRQTGGSLDDYLSPAGKGWELYLGQDLREGIRKLHDELVEDSSFPVNPVDVGRYDAVLSANCLKQLLNGSVGAATQLDRALGYEANAGGTSYLNDPQSMIGSYVLGAPALHVTANRNAPGGVATVKWDDEGVEPDEFVLVNAGVIADFQTTRESAGWMQGWSNRPSTPIRSHGCASAPEGVDAPVTHIPNLVMTPGQVSNDFSTLISGMAKGVAIKGANVDLDFQQLNGFARGAVYEVRNGKRIAVLANAGLLLRVPEFWKSIIAMGGKESVIRYGTSSWKSEPPQVMTNSVDVIPIAVKDLTIIDVLRKA